MTPQQPDPEDEYASLPYDEKVDRIAGAMQDGSVAIGASMVVSDGNIDGDIYIAVDGQAVDDYTDRVLQFRGLVSLLAHYPPHVVDAANQLANDQRPGIGDAIRAAIKGGQPPR